MAFINLEKYQNNLPAQLIDHLQSPQVDDVSINYVTPEIKPMKCSKATDQRIKDDISKLRLPARINNALIPYPTEIRDYIKTTDKHLLSNIHNHHQHHIIKVRTMVERINEGWAIGEPEIRTDINSLKQLVTGKFSHRSDIIHNAAVAFGKRSTVNELSMIGKSQANPQFAAHESSPFISLLVAIHRLRVYIGRASRTKSSDYDYSPIKDVEPKFILLRDFSYVYGASNEEYTSIICSSGGHFGIYTSRENFWFMGPVSYLDYMFTVADILNNLGVILMMNEYKWAEEFIQIITELINPKYDHNTAVEFMKTLEAYALNISDYDETHAMNWKPILDIGQTIWKLDKRIANLDYDFELLLLLISGKNVKCPRESLLCRLTKCIRKMTRNQMQEASALHKFIFYAEINPRAGVMKFLKRVHTPRPMDKRAIKEITRLAKQEFFLSYSQKHRTCPNLLGDLTKITALKIHINRKEYSQIKSYPLIWWDDIKIFNCMDNTMTDDALEFAKDKGALKKEIKFGPGDSRKELLQLIETENYKLKDFFEDAPFKRKDMNVYSTTKHSSPYPTKHPARLIEKEREQKIEARLFANGELSDKHALSVVATKMKKVLSYFDEQLMTPSDKKRKELLHRAAQSLIGTDNYSLLLDIEGHNQSMQPDNTSELAEFCGLLFGEEGWGTIPDYFGVLDVYHYDEYKDSVILSNGQLGGIEGWLNPLWTMHTMICIKLIRHMTSLNLTTSMTYSDDVNAIINIPQATEATVQATFKIIMSHFIKFGMIVKMSQTNMSKHRVTMLRQHYSDGVRSDSTLKKLISVSGANNAMLMADSLEVAGICSSISSALEMSNHISTCIYLKNYKLGLLLARFPHMLLSRPQEKSMLSPEELPAKLSVLLYNIKDDKSHLLGSGFDNAVQGMKNDLANYLNRNRNSLGTVTLTKIMKDRYKTTLLEEKFIDSPDKMLYLQLYDEFIQDLLFFLIHMPESLGGLGGSLCINLILSGHSSGTSKALHYIKEWITNWSVNKSYFLKYLNVTLTVDMNHEINKDERRLLNSYWPNDVRITSVVTSISSSIKSMIKWRTKNRNVLNLLTLSEDTNDLKEDFINIFRHNYHQRITQFYAENTSVHFLDLLVSKIESSSGLLTAIKSITSLRNSVCSRAIENVRMSSVKRDILHPWIIEKDDIIEVLIKRRQKMFPEVDMILVDEPLYDDKLSEITEYPHLFTVRQCSPMHFENGIRVYDDPDLGNEIRYKGELLDDDRMIGNKEELMAAKLVAVTKWFLTKYQLINSSAEIMQELDCVKACNLSLSTLTGQTLMDLWNYSPNETGGEILHRIPNMRFNCTTYIRSDINRSLRYTVDTHQFLITQRGWIDSNINFDYIRLRLLLIAMVRDLSPNNVRFKTTWDFNRYNTFEDVQFIKPKISKFIQKKNFKCYGILRHHEFSVLRYRYLSSYYLNIEEQNELALMPNLEESSSSRLLGVDLMQELIYNYANSLDREYMSIMPETIDYPLWVPLMNKLENLDSKLKNSNLEEKINFLKVHLSDILVKRRKVTIISSNDPVSLSIQTQCLKYLDHYRPKDVYHNAMVKRYGDLFKSKKYSFKLNSLNAKYQNILNEHTKYKRKLAIALISEYILMYHFKTSRLNDYIKFDYDESINEYMTAGIGKMTAAFITPELMVQILIIGHEYINHISVSEREAIKETLHEISEDNHLADVLTPEVKTSLKPNTTLDGREFLSDTGDSIYYDNFDLPYTAMETYNEILPLLHYARKCCDIGTDPRVYESATGSDSYMAQYGLFNALINDHSIHEDTRICDLTAGRGDFQFVCSKLNLNAKSYSIIDTFTRLLYHPEVNHDLQYNVRDIKSLKFLTEFEWVHVDLSFVGSEGFNALDLILFFEENNIAYSIRMNSITLEGYDTKSLEGFPYYNHKLYTPTNSKLKPYQVYLVGMPGKADKQELKINMKNTVGFRSMALAYSRLLSPENRLIKLDKYQANSSSIYMRAYPDILSLCKEICSIGAISAERYYLERLFSEIDKEEELHFVLEKCETPDLCLGLIQEKALGSHSGPVYTDYSPEGIGNVSDKSLKYHVSHLHALQNPEIDKFSVELLQCGGSILEYFRSHHPLSSVRSQCNTIIGIKQFVRVGISGDHNGLEARYRELSVTKVKQNSLHQQEYQTAIKLLLLSAYYDDYSYGINYCHVFLQHGKQNHKFYTSIIKIYRCISYIYEDLRKFITRGAITYRDLISIKHDLVDRTEKKIRYREIIDPVDNDLPDPLTGINLIEIDFDKLFSDLENYATEGMLADKDQREMEQSTDVFMQMNLNFDLKIEEKINNFISLNPGLKTNIFGQIDLGDDMDDMDPDLM